MNSKTVLTAVIGAVAGLALAMGAVAFAQNTGHMGNTQGTGMMGQTSQQSTSSMATHDKMHGKTAALQGIHGSMHAQSSQDQRPVARHHTDNSQTTGNHPCPADKVVKGGPET